MNWDWESFWSYVGGLISYALLIIVLGLVSSLLAEPVNLGETVHVGNC